MKIKAVGALILAWHSVFTAAAEWPQFRGPEGQGHADGARFPTDWSESENITWKTAIPGMGLSSPVVCGDQIWMTTAVEGDRSLHAICVSAGTGQIVHSVELFRVAESAPLHPKNSHATSTPVIEDGRVYVNFGASGTACLSSEGEVLWKNSALEYHQPYASASSPVVFQNLLILCCDGTDLQFVVGLDKYTGKIVWRQPRRRFVATGTKNTAASLSSADFPLMAYSTPLVITLDGVTQLVSAAAGHVASCDARTGEPLWWFRFDGFSLVARPVYGKGVVYVPGFEQRTKPVLFAIPADKRGEVKEADLRWTIRENACHVPSPLLLGDALFMISDAGIATYWDVASGQRIWRRRIGGNFSASPIYAKGKVLILNEDGEATILAANSEFKQIGQNWLEGAFLASPAVVGDSLLLRSDTHLYRIDAGN